MSKISQQRKLEILNAAYEEFTHKGIDGTSMTDIANRAGIGKSTIYEYFPSKRQLLADACVQFIQDMEEAIITKLTQEGTVAEKMLAYCITTRNYMAMVEALGGMAQKSTTSADTLRQMVEEQIKGYTQRLEEVLLAELKKGQQTGEIRLDADLEIAPMVLRSLPSVQLVWGLDRMEATDGMERVVALVMAGILA